MLASRLWRASRDAAESKFVNGRVKRFDPDLVAAAKEELTDVMAYSYLLRRKLGSRRRRISKDVGIEFASPIHDAASEIADQFDLELGNIKARFESTAGGAINTAVSDIRGAMNSALSQATKDGLTTKDATEYVIDAIREHGVEPRSTAYVETLVRTHSAISYGAAHRESFIGDPDVWGFVYVTVGDNRVREAHERLDGIQRKADDDFWNTFWPPNGWNCRCQAVAIFDEEAKQTKVPADVEPDEGFDTDFQELL